MIPYSVTDEQSPRALWGENSMHHGIGRAHLANLLLKESDSTELKMTDKERKAAGSFFHSALLFFSLCDELKVCHFYSLTVSDFTTEECLILLNGERAS